MKYIGNQPNSSIYGANGVWSLNQISTQNFYKNWPNPRYNNTSAFRDGMVLGEPFVITNNRNVLLPIDPTPSTLNFDPYYDLVSLLLHMDGADNSTSFVDSSVNNFTVTNTDSVAVSNSVSRFGGSALFDSSTKKLSVPAGSAFAYGTGDFTVECWAYKTAAGDGYVFSQTVSGTNYFVFGVVNDGRVFFTGTASGGGTAIFGPASTLSLNSWNHIAVVRLNNIVTVYLNGVGGTGTSNTTNFSDTTRVPTIGQYTHASTNRWIGYIDELRITRGFARYTANFTVPSTPFLP